MKKLILTGLSFLFAITLTFAQDVNPETKAQEKVEKLTEVLTLNDDQKASIFTIVLEKITAMEAIKADTTLEAAAAQEQLEGIKNSANQKIAEQLTDEQKEKFFKYLEEKNAKKEEEGEVQQ